LAARPNLGTLRLSPDSPDAPISQTKRRFPQNAVGFLSCNLDALKSARDAGFRPTELRQHVAILTQHSCLARVAQSNAPRRQTARCRFALCHARTVNRPSLFAARFRFILSHNSQQLLQQLSVTMAVLCENAFKPLL